MSEHSRQERRFDLEAEKRQRRNFLLMVVGLAVIAMLGGIVFAWWLWEPAEEQAPPPIQAREEAKPAVGNFQPFEEAEPVEAPDKPSGLKRQLENNDIDRGLGKIRAGLNKCAAKHGAIDGTRVTVDFSVAASGRVTEAYARPPHTGNPLGVCVAGVIRDQARFRRTREGLGDVRRTLTLRRTSL